MGIPLELGYHMEQNLQPVGHQLDPCFRTVSPMALDCTGILIYQCRDDNRISHVIGHYTSL